jgi:protein-S-isoprenylcysteine O-methyltransferase Ste14
MSRLEDFFKTFLFLLVLPFPLLVFIPYALRNGAGLPVFEMGALRWVGWLVFAVGAGIMLYSIFAFIFEGEGTPAPIDPPTRLVAEGIYRYTRNPMYVGGLVIVFGGFLVYGAAAVLIWMLIVFSGFHAFVVLYEEPKLREMFGESYEAYCKEVPRWWRFTGG